MKIKIVTIQIPMILRIAMFIVLATLAVDFIILFLFVANNCNTASRYGLVDLNGKGLWCDVEILSDVSAADTMGLQTTVDSFNAKLIIEAGWPFRTMKFVLAFDIIRCQYEGGNAELVWLHGFKGLFAKPTVFGYIYVVILVVLYIFQRCIKRCQACKLGCVRCAYDVSGLRNSVCPECGKIFKTNEHERTIVSSVDTNMFEPIRKPV